MAATYEEILLEILEEPTPPDPDGLYEYVDGDWKEKVMGGESSWIANRLGSRLDLFIDENNLGYLFNAECSYRCFPEDRKKFRRPDLSFVKRGRFLDERIPLGRIELAPDLVVEVISPNDTYVDVEARLEDFRRVGVPLMWVVNPADRTVKIYRDGSVIPEVRTQADELDGGAVLPGWSCPIQQFFPAPIGNR